MTLLRAAIILAVVWVGVVASLALSTWPAIPLDLDARDPNLQQIYRAAVTRHLALHAAAAVIPAVLVVWMARRRSRGRQGPQS